MISKAFQLLEEQENEIVLPSYIKATNLRNYLADELDIICQDALGFVQQKQVSVSLFLNIVPIP